MLTANNVDKFILARLRSEDEMEPPDKNSEICPNPQCSRLNPIGLKKCPRCKINLVASTYM